MHACSYVYFVPKVGELAEKLAKITPGRLQKTFFCNSGAEANEGAMRLAKRYTGTMEFVALESSFHGRTYATLSITGNSGRKKGGSPYMPGVAFAPTPYCYRCPLGFSHRETCGLACAERVREVIRLHLSGSWLRLHRRAGDGRGRHHRAAGRLLQGRQGDPRRGAACSSSPTRCSRGFGRTGKLFAVEHYGVEPGHHDDGQGHRRRLAAGRLHQPRRDRRQLPPGDHLSTFGGNPVSCAASSANIDYHLEHDLAGNATRKGAAVQAALKELAKTSR